MEKTGCKIIYGAPTTLAVKGLIILLMTLYDIPYVLQGREAASVIGVVDE